MRVLQGLRQLSTSGMLFGGGTLLLGLGCASVPAYALQEEQATPIIVTGDKELEDKRRDEASRFVRSMNVAHSEKQVARWWQGVCPKVLGVDDKIAARVEKTIRQVATDAKVPIAKKGCDTNIVVAFTIGGDGLAQKIVARERRVLSDVAMPDRSKILTRDVPIRWWYNIETVNADGTPPQQSATFPVANTDYPDIQSVQRYSPSIVKTSTVETITAATVIIDVARAEGKNLDAVAAYAAMVALAEIDIDANPDKSIMSLFEADSDAAGMTDNDKSFLAAIYQLDLDRWGRAQRGQIVRAVAKGSAQE